MPTMPQRTFQNYMEAIREFGQGNCPQDCQQNQITKGQCRHSFPGWQVSTVVRIINTFSKKEDAEEHQRVFVKVREGSYVFKGISASIPFE